MSGSYSLDREARRQRLDLCFHRFLDGRVAFLAVPAEVVQHLGDQFADLPELGDAGRRAASR